MILYDRLFVSAINTNIPGRTDVSADNEAQKVGYVLSYLGAWRNNRIRWSTLCAKRGIEFPDFDTFKRAIRGQFGDPTTPDQWAQEFFDNGRMVKGESVRDFQARIYELWTEANLLWNDEADANDCGSREYMLYSFAYDPMHTWIKGVIAPFVPLEAWNFASIAGLFDRAELAEVTDCGFRAAGSTTTTTTTETTSAPQYARDTSGSKRHRDRRNNPSCQSGAATTFNPKRQKTVDDPSRM